MDPAHPIIGITADAEGEKLLLGRALAETVHRAGGVPLILPCIAGMIDAYVTICDGFVLSGGDDPDTRAWGEPLHPKAKPIDAERQAFEWSLLDALEALEAGHAAPTLGVCLGMQMMTLHAGGALDQHLPDTLATAGDHWGHRSHAVAGALGDGLVHSHHRQAITDAGRLRVVATAHDGVIEAVRSVDRPFHLGVQWHPERTPDERLGLDLFRRLVDASREASASVRAEAAGAAPRR